MSLLKEISRAAVAVDRSQLSLTEPVRVGLAIFVALTFVLAINEPLAVAPVAIGALLVALSDYISAAALENKSDAVEVEKTQQKMRVSREAADSVVTSSLYEIGRHQIKPYDAQSIFNDLNESGAWCTAVRYRDFDHKETLNEIKTEVDDLRKRLDQYV